MIVVFVDTPLIE